MDTLIKILPFLARFPKWLQVFFFAVLFQILLLAFLSTVYAFRATIAQDQPTAVKAIVVPQTSGAQGSFPQPVPSAPAVPKKRPAHVSKDTLSPSLRVSSVLKEVGGFPVMDVVILNASTGPVVLTEFDVNILQYDPYLSIPESRVLAPIALVDVVLPFGTGNFTHKLDPSILIAANDAVTIAFRFHTEYQGKSIRPSETAAYAVRLVLRADTGITGETDVVKF